MGIDRMGGPREPSRPESVREAAPAGGQTPGDEAPDARPVDAPGRRPLSSGIAMSMLEERLAGSAPAAAPAPAKDDPAVVAGETALLEGKTKVGRGASGPLVTNLQQMLAAIGYPAEGEAGTYGPKTEDAVRRFQRASGGVLKETGIIDRETFGGIIGAGMRQTLGGPR